MKKKNLSVIIGYAICCVYKIKLWFKLYVNVIKDKFEPQYIYSL